MRIARWSLLTLLAACRPDAPTTPTAPRPAVSANVANAADAGAPAAAQAPVVIAIVVDQLAGWIAEERLPLLPSGAG